MAEYNYNGITFTYTDSVEVLREQTDNANVRKAELKAAGSGVESFATLLDMVHYLRTGGSMEQQEVAKMYGVSKSHISKACKVVREALPATVASTKVGRATVWGMTDEEVVNAVGVFLQNAGVRTGINSLYEDLGKDDDEPKVWSFAEQAAVLAKRAYKRAGMTPDEMVEAFAAVVAGMTFE